MLILTRALFANNDILLAVSTEFERKDYLAKMNYYPSTWRGAQCNRIGCIGLRPALPSAVFVSAVANPNLVIKSNPNLVKQKL